MKNAFYLSFALATFACTAFGGCPPTPPVPPGPPPVVADARPTPSPDVALTACQAACANLQAIGCHIDIDCAAVCQRVQDAHLTNLKPECLTKAKTPDEARACGTVMCVTE